MSYTISVVAPNVTISGLEQYLHGNTQFTIGASTSDYSTAHSLISRLNPNLTIVDILQEPGCVNTDVIQQIHKISPNMPILVYSRFKELRYGMRCLKDGAKGYLEQNRDLLITVLHRLCQGCQYFSDDVLKLAEAEAKLTEREKQVYILLGQGYKNVEIAEQLDDISPKTVEHFRILIRNKLNTDETLRLFAALYAYTEHLQSETAWEGIPNPGRVLTHSQFAVFKMTGDPHYGDDTKKIANVLEITVKTAEIHRLNGMKRLGIKKSPKYVVLAALFRAGLVPEDFDKQVE